MSYKEKHKTSGFKVGDKVIVTRASLEKEEGWPYCWVESMNDYIGIITTITEDRYNGFILEVDGYCFPYFVLKLASSKQETKSNDYPHVCPRCGAPAYCGLQKVDCSRGCQ